jgi:hypothetical protein
VLRAFGFEPVDPVDQAMIEARQIVEEQVP